jgi:hypothetical protein
MLKKIKWNFFLILLVSQFLRILKIFLDILKADKIFFKIVSSELFLLYNHDVLLKAEIILPKCIGSKNPYDRVPIIEFNVLKNGIKWIKKVLS